METQTFEMPQDEAIQNLADMKEMFKRNKYIKQQEIYSDMRKVYGHMQHGGKVLDLHASMKMGGLNEDGDPSLAICRADAEKVYVIKHVDGSAVFSSEPWRGWRDTARKSYKDLTVPPKTFEWIPKEGGKLPIQSTWWIKNRTASTIVPLIPPKILIDAVKRSLGAYYILWDVEKWEPEPPVDPILLKKLTPNLFGVLATWDLTELERSILKSHVLRNPT